MILDTSAVIAILAQEEDAKRYIEAVSHAKVRRMSAATWVELFMVAESQFGVEVSRQCDALLRRAAVSIEPVTMEQACIARQAFLDFGKGRHKASLNYGDCFSYALAKAMHEPLLFKGQDFVYTDVVCA